MCVQMVCRNSVCVCRWCVGIVRMCMQIVCMCVQILVCRNGVSCVLKWCVHEELCVSCCVYLF